MKSPPFLAKKFVCSPFIRNPGVPTIEEDLIEALAKAEAFPEEMKDNLGKVRRHLLKFGGWWGG